MVNEVAGRPESRHGVAPIMGHRRASCVCTIAGSRHPALQPEILESNMNKTKPAPVSTRVGITLNTSERAALDDAARKAFVTPSTLARTLMLSSLTKPTRDREPATA